MNLHYRPKPGNPSSEITTYQVSKNSKGSLSP